jgi:hypothetical protein
MAKNKAYKFRELFEMQTFLNGGLIGGSLQKSVGSISVGLVGLVGKSLKFTQPTAVEYTFIASSGSNPDPNTLLFSDIQAQLMGAVAGLLVTSWEGRLVFIETTPNHGVTLVNATVAGTDARGILGFGNGATDTQVGKLYTPSAVSNAAPCWTWAYSLSENMHTVLTWE